MAKRIDKVMKNKGRASRAPAVISLATIVTIAATAATAVSPAPTFFGVDWVMFFSNNEEVVMASMILRWLGRLAAVAGVLLSAVSGILRLQGHFWLGGFQAGTLLLGGIALMVFACLCYLVLIERQVLKR